MELRTGSKGLGMGFGAVSDQLTVEMLFDLIGVRLIAERVSAMTFDINWRFTDINEDHLLGIDNCALHHRPGARNEQAEVSVSLTKADLAAVLRADIDINALIDSDGVQLEGDPGALRLIFGALDEFSGLFGIVEP